MTQLTEYLRGANDEMRKVVWPSREETIRSTVYVIGISVGVGLFFWVLDLAFNYVLSAIIK